MTKLRKLLLFGATIILAGLLIYVWMINFKQNEKDKGTTYVLQDTTGAKELDPKKMLLLDIYKKLMVPTRQSKVDPVVSKHISFLKANGNLSKNMPTEDIQKFSVQKLNFRGSRLTSKERGNAKICTKYGRRDQSQSYSVFFGSNVQLIRRNHHTYLNEQSIMVEVGGNWGWDAGNFSNLYGMRHVILEPLGHYVKILKDKFRGNPKVSIYELGLGAVNEKLMVALEGNNACATSKFSKKNGSTPIYIINAIDFFSFLGVGVYEVDLLSMICEGCEYETLETLLKYNIIDSFRNIQWATHTQLKGLPNPFGRYCEIQELLRRTHRPTYQYKFNWENWRRKDIK